MKAMSVLLLLILVSTALVQLLLPWWSIVPICLVLAAWRGPTGGRAFLAGLLGVALSWWLPALWLNTHGAGLLAARVATLLPLGGNAGLLVLVSGVLAGLVGGLAALSGILLRRAFRPKPASKPVTVAA